MIDAISFNAGGSFCADMPSSQLFTISDAAGLKPLIIPDALIASDATDGQCVLPSRAPSQESIDLFQAVMNSPASEEPSVNPPRKAHVSATPAEKTAIEPGMPQSTAKIATPFITIAQPIEPIEHEAPTQEPKLPFAEFKAQPVDTKTPSTKANAPVIADKAQVIADKAPVKMVATKATVVAEAKMPTATVEVKPQVVVETVEPKASTATVEVKPQVVAETVEPKVQTATVEVKPQVVVKTVEPKV